MKTLLAISTQTYTAVIALLIVFSVSKNVVIAQCSGSCTSTITMPSAAALTVAAGEYKCLNGTGTHSGGITINGGTLEVCTGATVTITGAQDWYPGFGTAATVSNKGTLTVNSSAADISIGLYFVNSGTATFSDNIAFNSNGLGSNDFETTSTGKTTVNGNFNATISEASSFIIVSNKMTVTGNFVTGGSGGGIDVRASSRLTVGGTVTKGGNAIKNANSIYATTVDLSGATTDNMGGGYYNATNLICPSGTINPAGQCAVAYVTGGVTVNSGTTYNAEMWLVDVSGYTAGSDRYAGVDITAGTHTLTTNCFYYDDGDNPTLPAGCHALPVSLLYFKSAYKDGSVALSWATSIEKDNKKFHIMRSLNGEDWKTIAELPGRGNSTEITEYHFNDQGPFYSNQVYYRLTQEDYDGTVSNSYVIAEELNPSDVKAEISPNPIKAGESMDIFFSDAPDYTIHSLSVTRIDGVVVIPQLSFEKISSQLWRAVLPSYIEKGSYVLSVHTRDTQFHSKMRVE